MENYKIYLCGGMEKFGKSNFAESNNWRKYCSDALSLCDSIYNVIPINPNDYFSFLDNPPSYKTQREIMNFDLNKLRDSNLVIINFNDVYSLGSMAEISIAYDRGIPIIGLKKPKQKLHSWQVCMCERIFDNIDDLLDYVEDFYLR